MCSPMGSISIGCAVFLCGPRLRSHVGRACTPCMCFADALCAASSGFAEGPGLACKPLGGGLPCLEFLVPISFICQEFHVVPCSSASDQIGRASCRERG